MLTRIELWHFKCFENLVLDCAPLNLLCGLNGTGKSSAIQSLLLLRQSVESRSLSQGRLDLVGERIDLGTGTDVIHDGDVVPFVRFHLHSSDVDAEWELEFEHSTPQTGVSADHDGLFATVGGLHLLDFLPDGWDDIQPFAGRLVYVSADRIGPRSAHPQSSSRAFDGDFGSTGDYALNYLHSRQRDSWAGTDPRCVNGRNQLLIDVVDLWSQEISPGAHLDMQSVEAAGLIIPGFSFDQPGDVPTRPYRATNVGFGLSYTLPVILAFLSEPGTLCLIENPEAHLHPRGQTKLGELAARAASAGVQIFVETHSDHFMDGVRIAVRDGLIKPDDVTFNYFQREGNTATVTCPEINEDGRLSDWPEGFFDQNALNLAQLLAPKA